MSTIIIAEAGVNHNGDVLIAKELINVAKDSGAVGEAPNEQHLFVICGMF